MLPLGLYFVHAVSREGLQMVPVPRGSPACPTGWDDYLPGGTSGQRGKCFQTLTDKTWSECRDSCAAAGGSQLCVRSEEESIFIRDL